MASTYSITPVATDSLATSQGIISGNFQQIQKVLGSSTLSIGQIYTAQGDMLFASDTATLQKLAKASTPSYIMSAKGPSLNPSWMALAEITKELSGVNALAALKTLPGLTSATGLVAVDSITRGTWLGTIINSSYGGTGLSLGQVKVGTYTGNNAASQGITITTGYQANIVIIYRQEDVGSFNLFFKTSSDGTKTHSTANTGAYEDDHIISLDANGFTVGDGSGSANRVNANGKTYTYIAIKTN